MNLPAWLNNLQKKELLNNGYFIEEMSYAKTIDEETEIIAKYLLSLGWSYIAKFEKRQLPPCVDVSKCEYEKYGNSGLIARHIGEYKFNGNTFYGCVEYWQHSGDTYGVDFEITLYAK
jgi:hypothetical protein